VSDYYFYKKHSYLVPARQSYLVPSTGYSFQPGAGSIEDLFQTKLSRTNSRIEALIEAIDRRSLIREQNLGGIEEDLSRCQNLLFDLGYRIYRRDRQWEALELKRLDLLREKRMEEAACFRDATLLGKELRDNVSYFQALVDKQRVFGMGEEKCMSEKIM
jgi:hypothetical protein